MSVELKPKDILSFWHSAGFKSSDDVSVFKWVVSNTFLCPSMLQSEWREEVKKHFEKIKSEGTCIHRLDEELIRRRRDELR